MSDEEMKEISTEPTEEKDAPTTNSTEAQSFKEMAMTESSELQEPGVANLTEEKGESSWVEDKIILFKKEPQTDAAVLEEGSVQTKTFINVSSEETADLRNVEEDPLLQCESGREDAGGCMKEPFPEEGNASCSAVPEGRSSWSKIGEQIIVKEEPLLQDESVEREIISDSDPSAQHIVISPDQQSRGDSSWTMDEGTRIKGEPLSDVEEEDIVPSERNMITLDREITKQETNESWMQTEEPSDQSRKRRGSASSDLVKRESSQSVEDPSRSYSQIRFCNRKKYSCSECGDMFQTLDDVSVHREVHGQMIGIDINDKEELALHDTSENDALTLGSPSDGRAAMTVKNEVCTDSERSDNPIACGDCGKSFSELSHLEAHLCPNSDEKSYKCSDCTKLFTSALSLKIHMRFHAIVKPYTCDDCGQSFTEVDNLKKHKRVHKGDKAFVCEDCGKSFSGLGHLTRHERTHTDVKLFTCKHCSKSFSRRYSLRIHERTHTGEKPYTCKHCSKTFTNSGNLNKHMRTHTGVKPYSCKHCDILFTDISHRKVHERTHTGVKPYTCKHCSKSFIQSNNLKRHERIHALEKSFSCKHCGKLFKHAINLKKHEDAHSSSSANSKKDL